MLKFIKEITLAPQTNWLSSPVESGIFPGLCLKKDGTLSLLFISGSDFESSDQRVFSYSGTPDGLDWTYRSLWDEIRIDGHIFTACAKPTVLPDGRLLALGYGYVRDMPEMSISEYAEKHGRFPTVKNFVAFSDDGGYTYAKPEFLNLPRPGIEFSGPAVLMDDGRLLAFGPPFNIENQGQIGLCYESIDGGKTWREKSIFHHGNTVATWECRGISLGGPRVAVIVWCFDCQKQCHLTNRLAFSEDAGETWQLFDTGLPGQAANLLKFPDKSLGIVYAKREGEKPGIYLAKGQLLPEKGWIITETELLYDAAQSANVEGQILQQFNNLKFGQPSLTTLQDGSYLLLFWQKRDDKYQVIIRKYIC